MSRAEELLITEIFYSLQGESTTTGLPTVFVRLTGCPLRCGYCDTAYAFTGGEHMTIDAVMSRVAAFGCKQVTVTGGEPLSQTHCVALLKSLCDEGYRVSLETSGAIDITAVDERVMIVMDLKTPGSGEVDRNLYDNLERLRGGDQVKFVICDRSDYDWARDCVRKYDIGSRNEVLFSPSYGQQDARQLAEWILQDRLPVRMQLQLHKILWGEEAGH